MKQLSEQEARQMMTLANTRNVDKVVEQYADDATFQVPSLDAPIRGKASIRSYLESAYATFPDWTMDVSKVIVSGNDVVVVNSVHGTHTGPFTARDGKAITPTYKLFVEEQLTHVVINEHGKISSFRAYGNPSDMHRLLGFPQSVTTHRETTSTVTTTSDAHPSQPS